MKDGGNDVGNAALTSGAGLGVTTSVGSFLGWLNMYIGVISLALTVISIFIGVYFSVQTMKWRRRQEREQVERLRKEIIEELRKQGLD